MPFRKDSSFPILETPVRHLNFYKRKEDQGNLIVVNSVNIILSLP